MDPTSPLHWLAFGFGAGLAPWAQGSLGTLVFLPFWWGLAGARRPVYLAVLAGLILFGAWLCGVVAIDVGNADPGGVVWDEFAGLLLTAVLLPRRWWAALAGFLVFRFFDVLKPWPVAWVDTHVGGGVGIMADDLVAGVYGLAVLALLLRLDRARLRPDGAGRRPGA